MSLTETTVAEPCLYDYDAAEDGAPVRWPQRFDVSNWRLIGAHRDGARVGGAVVAVGTPGLRMLDGRDG